MFARFVAFLANTFLVRRHALKVKILLMTYPFIVVVFLNHWLAAFAAFGVHVFLSSVLIKLVENQTGLSIYAEKIFDIEGLRRLDVIKMLIMLCVGIPSVMVFSSINPLRIIFISGFY